MVLWTRIETLSRILLVFTKKWIDCIELVVAAGAFQDFVSDDDFDYVGDGVDLQVALSKAIWQVLSEQIYRLCIFQNVNENEAARGQQSGADDNTGVEFCMYNSKQSKFQKIK